MQSQKFVGFSLLSTALLAITMPSVTSPAIANPRIIPGYFDYTGKIYDASHNVNINCAEISVYIKKLLPDGSAQNITSIQAKRNSQKDGFCTYSYPVKFLYQASSYIVIATYDRKYDYCGDNRYCDVKKLGEDLYMYLHLH